jgi:hypothetical protein
MSNSALTLASLHFASLSSPHLDLPSLELTAEAEAEAYGLKSAGTIIPGIEPRWDPWP